MLTFLRKIRRTLVGSGGAGRYMIYAIGEIALVVIGILIALQINNWNENNKDRALEKRYYCILYEDVLQDNERINQLISQIAERKTNANQLLRILLDGEYNAREILLQYLKTIRGSGVNFEPNDAAYLDLKSSGNLNLIQDIKIKDLLNDYFKSIAPFVKTNQLYIDYVGDQYFNLSKYHKQTGMVAVELGTDEIGIEGFKFEEDIVNKLKQLEVKKLPKEFHDTYFNLAYNMATNMERRMQLLESIKVEVSKIKQALSEKCPESN